MIVHRVEHNRHRTRLLVSVCETRIERARGLLLRRCPDALSALMLAPCNAIHTFGMTYRIDVIFCAENGRILQVVEALPPWRVAQHPDAASVWELRAGTAQTLGIKPGDRLRPC